VHFESGESVFRVQALTAAAICGFFALSFAPAARAEEDVTYEVTSDYIGTANYLNYFDGTTRMYLENVPLPWRITVPVADPQNWGTQGAELHANWRRSAWPSKWVTARIFIGDKLVCENSLDVGNASCYGSAQFRPKL
jgi:hypothetical protein